MEPDKPIENVNLDRIKFNTRTGKVKAKIANRRGTRELDGVDVIEVKTSVPVKSRVSSKTVKYSFKEPVSVKIGKTDLTTSLYVDDAK